MSLYLRSRLQQEDSWVLLQLDIILLRRQEMDPRPYNYEFRRPRYGNRTYQSYNAYESLYHMGKVDPGPYQDNFMKDNYISRQNRYSSVHDNNVQNRQIPESGYYPQIEPQRQSKQYQNTAVNTDKYSSSRGDSNRSVRSKSSMQSSQSNQQITTKPSVLASYGSSSLHKPQKHAQVRQEAPKVNVVYNSYQDAPSIYQRQQRPFNIINLHSKNTEPLRKYPKLHLEHLILQRGMDNL